MYMFSPAVSLKNVHFFCAFGALYRNAAFNASTFLKDRSIDWNILSLKNYIKQQLFPSEA